MRAPLNPVPLLQALADAGAQYVLVGGLAGAMLGTTRNTRDIDIAYASHHENLERICAVINRFHPRLKLLGKAEGDAISITPAHLRKNKMLQLVTDVGELDLLGAIAGFNSFAQIAKMSDTKDIGFVVHVLGVDGMLRAKKALKRPKDIQDIVELEALKEMQELHAMRIRPPDVTTPEI